MADTKLPKFDWTDVRMELEASGRADLSEWVGAQRAAEAQQVEADATRWRTLLTLDYPTVCTIENDCGDWIPIHPERITEVIDAIVASKEQDHG